MNLIRVIKVINFLILNILYFSGGISSYCMSLMIIAFLIDFGKFSNESHEILPEIFAFYGKKFNPKEMGISFKLTPRYFLTKEL